METLCFVMKEKVLCLGFQKRTQLEICGYVVFTTLFQNRSTQILECVCAAHFTEDYFLNLGVACQLCTKTVSIKWGNSNYRPALPREYRRSQRNRVRSWPTLHGRVRVWAGRDFCVCRMRGNKIHELIHKV